MRALGPIGWDGRGVASSPDLLVAEAQFPRPKSMGKTTYQTSIPRVKNFRRSWGTHSARAVLECPRVSFAADEIRLIRPINVLNIVATVATDDHLARLHGGFILPPSSLCISFPLHPISAAAIRVCVSRVRDSMNPSTISVQFPFPFFSFLRIEM